MCVYVVPLVDAAMFLRDPQAGFVLVGLVVVVVAVVGIDFAAFSFVLFCFCILQTAMSTACSKNEGLIARSTWNCFGSVFFVALSN